MFPDELKQLNNWCVWVYQDRGGKKTKLPINPQDGELAKSNDPSTWVSYDQALETYQKTNAEGLGFFFQPPYVGIDLDDVDDELDRFYRGDINSNIVYEFYETFKSYGEISPSGEGFHIIAKGKIPGEKRRKNNVEIYDRGRFFTMTGNTLGKYKEVTEVSEGNFSRIYRKYLQDKNNVYQLPFNDHGVTHNLSESEVVTRALDSKHGDRFNAFMSGGWEEYYTSHSEADLAFANMLAFWCARDFNQMDLIFRKSALMRSKWDEKRGATSYGEATLNKAINETANVYTPTTKVEPAKYDFKFLRDREEDDKEKEHPARSWDDTGNAQRFIDRYGDIVRYSYNRKRFYVYDGAKWTIDDMGLVNKLVDKTVEDLKNETLIMSDDLDEKEQAKIEDKFKKFITKSRNHSSKKNMLEEVKHLLAVSTDEFDKDDMLLNTATGYLDLTSGEIYPHDKDRMFSHITSSEYTSKFTPDTWLDFLEDIFAGDKEVIRYIQKAIGYSITGSVREQVMFICHGKGRNGKSIFIEVLAEILGSYANTIQADTLMVKNASGIGNDIARLQNSRFVTSSEPNEGFRFDEGLVKQLTGGDKVTARFLYGEYFEFNPKFKIWVTTNHKPIIRGTDDGIWRRMILIPFDVQIPKEKVDKDLKYKLMREAPGILDWAVEGSRLWQREGLELPHKIARASNDYRTDMDVLEHFIEDTCTRDKNGVAPAGQLYDKYKQWADDSGEYKMNKNTFGKKMKEKFSKKRVTSGMVYQGISINSKYPGLSQI